MEQHAKTSEDLCLSGLLFDELTAVCGKMGEDFPPFRIRQIEKRIREGCSDFEAMTELPRELRRKLAECYHLRSVTLDGVYADPDGTVKLRLLTADSLAIEAVILRDKHGRHTACLSTQAGCAMGCVFCKTGSLGFTRNLNAGEITGQLHSINGCLKADGRPPVSNIVFMGMGEPLLNLDALLKSIALLCALPGTPANRFSPRRITVSTCGLASKILEWADRAPGGVRLAVSLTTARQDLRSRLMPASSALAELKDALCSYQKQTGRRVTLELPLLGGINTHPEDAEALAVFARGLSVLVNLIPWNAAPGLVFEGKPLTSPSPKEAARFVRELEERHLPVVIRRSKGGAVAGACGQLGNAVALGQKQKQYAGNDTGKTE
jgi:23S rRNA (adenine2503-C2)-methyltransferase